MPCHPVSLSGRRVRGLLPAALAAGALAALAGPVASAGANAYQAVEHAYAISSTQSIPPCDFSSAELSHAESSVPNDSQQYDQDLIAAIQLALQARADGACKASSHRAANANVPVGTPAPPAVPPLAPSTPIRVGSATAATDAGLPAPLAILAVFAGLALLLAATVAVAHLRGRDSGWLDRSRHSWEEASYRVSGIWSDFSGRRRRPVR